MHLEHRHTNTSECVWCACEIRRGRVYQSVCVCVCVRLSTPSTFSFAFPFSLCWRYASSLPFLPFSHAHLPRPCALVAVTRDELKEKLDTHKKKRTSSAFAQPRQEGVRQQPQNLPAFYRSARITRRRTDSSKSKRAERKKEGNGPHAQRTRAYHLALFSLCAVCPCTASLPTMFFLSLSLSLRRCLPPRCLSCGAAL